MALTGVGAEEFGLNTWSHVLSQRTGRAETGDADLGIEGTMPEPLTGVVEGRVGDDEINLRQQTLTVRFTELWLTRLAATLLLGVNGALAICPCGDGICGGAACIPSETSQTCPADCGAPPPPPPPPPSPAELTVRVTVLPLGNSPSGDPGRFNLLVDNTTLKANVPDGGSTGPHILAPGPHTLSETASVGANLANYRTTICGACSRDGTIQPGVRQSCSITNLRLTNPAPAPGCPTTCVSALLQCGASGQPSEFCNDVFHRCLNRCQTSSARRFTIARFVRPGMPSANLTEVEADGILAEMSNVLRSAFNEQDDIECNVAFCRDGTIEEFATGDGIVDTEAEMHAVFALPQDIKIVKGIFFCGKMGSFNGCGNRQTFFVRRIARGISTVDAINWAHEYGHIRGLEHRNDPHAVMNSGTLPISTRVKPSECTAFRSGASLAAVDFSMLGPAFTAAATNVSAPLADIKDFVRQFFVHGIPYEEAMRYGPHVVPTLLDMLADPREAQAWPNIVIVLGMLGDDRAVTPLISLIEQNSGGQLDDFRYEAKENAILGLGYLVNKSGNHKALTYLKDGLDPSSWAERGIAWTSPEHETAAERNRELSRLAIIGLGLSGDRSAEEALAELLTPTPTLIGREFREQMSGVIWEALRANRKIAEQGLAKYYRTSSP
jgi:hypothetical protein